MSHQWRMAPQHREGMLLSPAHGLHEAEEIIGDYKRFTGHSVRPELVVMDVAEEHESYEANDMGPVEDLQTTAVPLTIRSHSCSLCSLRVGTSLSQLHCTNSKLHLNPTAITQHMQAMLSKTTLPGAMTCQRSSLLER